MESRNRVAIVIASVGRPMELGRWVEHVANQTLKPVEMIWSVASPTDLPPQATDRSDIGLRIVIAAKGLTKQRNAALDAISSTPDFVAFFDDDYIPTRDCIAGIVKSFEALPQAVGLSGSLIADGINSEGISHDTARGLIAAYERANLTPSYALRATEGLYGCNMAFPWEDARQHRFDERLPLYGWQEDWDFAARMAAGRPIGMTDGFVGLHQGTKGGRTSGRRLGYSQIANPVYLYRKGSMSRRKAFTLMFRNVLANHGRMIIPETWVDRRGRALGNWFAIGDLLRGRLRPERVMEMW